MKHILIAQNTLNNRGHFLIRNSGWFRFHRQNHSGSVLGVQMYKHNIAGFLQWGYNFYYSQYSMDRLDPYAANDGYGFAPAGDTYIVYPNQDGTPNASMRLPVFADLFQDIRALQLCEKLIGREAVLAMIEEGCDEPLSFSEYPRDAAYLLNLREKVNAAIAANL